MSLPYSYIAPLVVLTFVQPGALNALKVAVQGFASAKCSSACACRADELLSPCIHGSASFSKPLLTPPHSHVPSWLLHKQTESWFSH